MTTLVALFALSFGPSDPAADPDLPVALSASEPQDPNRVNLVWWLGGHLGYWEGFDADDGGFVIGAFGRVNILPWLSAEASLDFHREEYGGGVDVTVIPVQATALFHPWRFDKWRPYGLAGFGIYHIDVDAPGGDDSDVELGLHLGVGIEWHVTPTVLLDSSLRLGFVDGSFGDDLDFCAFYVGVAFKLTP